MTQQSQAQSQAQAQAQVQAQAQSQMTRDVGAGAAGGVGRRARILEVDALRGFALAGILVVNLMTTAGPPGARDLLAEVHAADGAVQWLVVLLAQSKFYLLFSFLFGYSFTLQMDSAARAGARFVPRMSRRLAALFVLGFAHAVLLYAGDILMIYALFGLLLLAVRNAGPAAVRRAALWVFGAAGGFLLLIGLGAALIDPAAAGGSDAANAELTAAYRGGFAEVVGANFRALPEAAAAVLLMGGFVAAAFLMGFVAGRRQWLGAAALADRARLRRILLTGLVVGIPGAAFSAAAIVGPLPERWLLLGLAVGMVAAPALSAAYATGLLLWFATPGGAATARVLAPAGRMALTNYLTQSLVMALVFSGYGLGLYGRTGAAAAVCGGIVLYAGQLALSGWLMRRYRLGPVEWLLRTVTLWARPGVG
ncbi:DUF418 domain-containing protein [Streptomyces sp. NBC_00439]|uniref:DUF418 domain-containing protein n=1 Tax=Streptomyces sp. NBC_00439 TaxID=2903650 RepID=UPI00225BBE32|nr:DUF418 domain-containing protein [Streptomyces sp. NBC_00439]MCX5100850.1 DUF418 domain-containing protein [Streptomyces sp. NBC_00439]